MRANEAELLRGVEQMESDAVSIGLCPAPFKFIREEIERLILERDNLDDIVDRLVQYR